MSKKKKVKNTLSKTEKKALSDRIDSILDSLDSILEKLAAKRETPPPPAIFELPKGYDITIKLKPTEKAA